MKESGGSPSCIHRDERCRMCPRKVRYSPRGNVRRAHVIVGEGGGGRRGERRGLWPFGHGPFGNAVHSNGPTEHHFCAMCTRSPSSALLRGPTGPETQPVQDETQHPPLLAQPGPSSHVLISAHDTSIYPVAKGISSLRDFQNSSLPLSASCLRDQQVRSILSPKPSRNLSVLGSPTATPWDWPSERSLHESLYTGRVVLEIPGSSTWP